MKYKVGKPVGIGLLVTTAALSIEGGGRVCGQELIWSKTGPADSLFGWSTSAMADTDGDGKPDVLVGAMLASPGVFDEPGKVFLLSGQDGATLLQVWGPYLGAQVGWTVADAGDVTGDGVHDILAGSLGAGARLYSGSDGSSVYAWGGGLAQAVAPGDVNGDGVPDLVVGAPAYSGTYVNQGAVFAYSGADASQLWVFAGPLYGGLAGYPGTVGDLNGDGVREVLVGAPGYNPITNPLCVVTGHAYVLSGGSGTFGGELQGPQAACDNFGAEVDGLGDVTGDGVADIAVGSGLNPTGQVRIFSGADMSLVTTLFGINTSEYFGHSIADPGDVDGDGVPDILVGAVFAPPVVGNVGMAGRAALRSGSDWSTIHEWLPPAGELMGMGRDVAGVGDVNGDDFPDVAVASPGGFATPYPPGIVRVFSGAPFGAVPYGLGCAGSATSIPRIGATRSPAVGESFTVNLSRTVPGRVALLILGFSSTAWGGAGLPLDLGFVGMAGCNLLVSPDIALAFTTSAFGPGNGRAVAPIGIPADPTLAGGQFFAQWFVGGPGPGLLPGSMTRGLAIIVQP